jgi:hypothetical protein
MRNLLTVALVVGVLAAGSAFATDLGTITFRYNDPGLSQASYIYLGGTSGGQGTSDGQGYYTGEYNFLVDTSHPATGPVGTALASNAATTGNVFGAFCIDVHQEAPTAFATYTITTPENAPTGNGNTPMLKGRADDLRKLFATHIGDVKDQNTGAAFEAAAWEIVFETATNKTTGLPDYNVSKGYLSLGYYWGSGWLGTAQGWLNDILADDAKGNAAPTVPLYALTSANYQDFALLVPGVVSEPSGAVPEPLTMIGMFLGVVGGGYYSRRRLQQKSM